MNGHWQLKTLDEICSVVRGGSPRPIQEFITSDPDGVNWIKISDATASGKYIYSTKEKISPNGVDRSRLVKPGDFLLSNSMSFGRPYIMRTSGCVHDGWLVLSDKSGEFEQDYLYYFLSSEIAYKQFDQLAAGSTVRNLNISSAKKVWIPLPPIYEQKCIVAILDEALAGIAKAAANTEKNIANVQSLFQNYLDSILAPKEGWTRNGLEDTVEKRCTLSYGIVQPGDDVMGGLPIVRPTDLKSKVIYLHGLKKIDPTLARGYKRTELSGGELLLCVRGGTGSVSVAAHELTGSNVTRGIVPIRFNPEVVIPEFAYFAFISNNIQKQIKAATYGAALMQINIRDVKKIQLDLPPIATQRVLLKKLMDISSEIEKVMSIYAQKAVALAGLKQALLENAFAGHMIIKAAPDVHEAAE